MLKRKKAIVITARQGEIMSYFFSFHANAINFLKIDIQILLIVSALKKKSFCNR